MKVRKTMSQEYRMPEGGQESYGKRLWHLWSPLILKMAIGFGVSVLAAGAFTIIFMAKNPDLVNQAAAGEVGGFHLVFSILKGKKLWQRHTRRLTRRSGPGRRWC